MPELCGFYGSIIAMYYRDHEPPHFHAIYARGLTAEYFGECAARGDKVAALRFLRRKGGESPRAGDESD